MIASVHFKCLGSLLAVFIFWLGTADAQNALQMRTNYYAVTGSSLREIRRSLELGRPRRGAAPGDGLTVWQIGWKVSTHRAGNVSRLSTFTTRTDITMTLPRWTVPTNADPELVKVWNDYTAALYQHERGHVQRVFATVAEMHTRVKTIPPAADPDALREQVEELARDILAAGKQRDRDYDDRTKRGETQGARFPGARPLRH